MMLNLGAQIRGALGVIMSKPVNLVSVSGGMRRVLVILLRLMAVLLIPGGTLATAYWWVRLRRGLNLRPPAHPVASEMARKNWLRI